MKPIVINAPRLLRFLSVVIDIHAMTVWPFIFSTAPLSDSNYRHEVIHLKQQRECMALGIPFVIGLWAWLGPVAGLIACAVSYLMFFILYGLFWLRGLAKYDGPTSYYRIPFEIEAYARSGDEVYLKTRHPFSWVDYL